VKSDRRPLLVVQSLKDYANKLIKENPAKGTINPPPRRRRIKTETAKAV
jgi:hypothetical protein